MGADAAMPPMQLHNNDDNHKPTLWPQGCWQCKCAPQGPPCCPMGTVTSGSGAKHPAGAATGCLAAVGDPGPMGTMAWRGTAVAGVSSQDPHEAPKGRKRLDWAASLPSLPPGHWAPREPRSFQLCQRGTVWCWQPVPQPPGEHGGPRPLPGSLPRPRCTPLPSSGWLLLARRLGGAAHAAPLHPCHTRMCPGMAPTDNQATLALLLLSPMAAALAWPQSRQHWGLQGTWGPVPVPSPAHVCAPSWAGVRGQGPGRGCC